MSLLLRSALFAAALLAAGCAAGASEGPYEGLEVEQPSAMPELVLPDTNGEPFDLLADTAEQVRLVYFGYTHCPDICPIHLSQLRDVLSRPGIPSNVAVVFITVDPDRDTPEVIRDYLDQFDEDFIGLTGTEEQLIEAQKAFGAIVAVRETDDENYTMGHDGRVFAFAPDGIGYTHYPHPTRQTAWVNDLPLLAAAGDEGDT